MSPTVLGMGFRAQQQEAEDKNVPIKFVGMAKQEEQRS